MRLWLKSLLAAAVVSLGVIGLQAADPVADQADAQVPVRPADRVFNRTGIQCTWCSLECLGRHNGIKALHTPPLTDSHLRHAGPAQVRPVLDRLGVKYLIQEFGQKDTNILTVSCERGWGCVVGLKGVHCVNLIHFDATTAKIIDNGDRQLRVQSWKRSTFLQEWDGFTIVVYEAP